MAVAPVDPRSLTDREAELLTELLSEDFGGSRELVLQVPLAQVVATWGEGSPSVDLKVLPGVQPAEIPDGEIPVAAQVHDQAGNFIGEITVWVSGGYLSAIEYGWITDTRPSVLPDKSMLTLVR